MCNTCDGTGKVACDVCRGEGCDNCRDTGWIPCPDCLKKTKVKSKIKSAISGK